MSRKAALCAVLLLLPVLAAAPQAGRKAAILVSSLRSGSKDSLTEDILVSELTVMLRNQGISVQAGRLSLPSGADRPRPPDEQRISRLLAGIDPQGANVVVATFYLMDGEQLTIQFALYDPVVEIVLGGVITRARKGLTVFTSVSSAVADFQPAVKRYVEGGYDVELPAGLVERIVVKGPQDGCRVIMVDKDFGLVSGGRLVIAYSQFQIGTAVPIKVMKDGYHDFEKIVPLTAAEMEIEIPPLKPETRVDAGIRWSFGMAAGGGVSGRFHIVPDSLFLGIEHYGSMDIPLGSAAAVRHYDTNIHLGQYIVFPHDSFFRVHVSAGIGLIVTDVQGLGGREYMDAYLLVGDPTAEFILGPATLFVRPDLHYALGVGYNLLGTAWIRTPFGLPPITVGVRLSW
jgi:hypothetical protein